MHETYLEMTKWLYAHWHTSMCIKSFAHDPSFVQIFPLVFRITYLEEVHSDIFNRLKSSINKMCVFSFRTIFLSTLLLTLVRRLLLWSLFIKHRSPLHMITHHVIIRREEVESFKRGRYNCLYSFPQCFLSA